MKKSLFKELVIVTLQAIAVSLCSPVILLNMVLTPILFGMSLLCPKLGNFYLRGWDKGIFVDVVVHNIFVELLLGKYMYSDIVPIRTKIEYAKIHPINDVLEIIGNQAIKEMTVRDVTYLISQNGCLTNNENFALRFLEVAEELNSLTEAEDERLQISMSSQSLKCVIKAAKKHDLWNLLDELLSHVKYFYGGLLSEEEKCDLVSHLTLEANERIIADILHGYDAEVWKMIPDLQLEDLARKVMYIAPGNEKIKRLLTAYDQNEELAGLVQFLVQKHGISDRVLNSLEENLRQKVQDLIKS